MNKRAATKIHAIGKTGLAISEADFGAAPGAICQSARKTNPPLE